ncbi:unnamed protein product [Lupinus luteus]|uniref:Calmodulin binding protein n=1 Tax=Lupinus luteus TaxID=3873 RepID=A0AAV1XLK6_LUPLU
MGGSRKWVKTFLLSKVSSSNLVDVPGSDKIASSARIVVTKSKKWRLWRSSSGGNHKATGSEGCDSPKSVVTDAFNAAVATVVRAQPKDFKLVREEWAATRIQTTFRAFLARRALKALKGVVKLQALVRGRQVRKQAAVTLRCMQALVRVQARVRARRVRMSIEGQAVQEMLNQRRTKADLLKEAEEGWCDSKGTLKDVKSKLQMRQEGAFKRERAIAYSLGNKQWRSTPISNSRPNTSFSTLSKYEIDKVNGGWSWLERWMAAKPWETRLMEQAHADASAKTPPPAKKSVLKSSNSKKSEPCLVKVRKNNVTTRISARPLHIGRGTRSSSSPSSEFQYEESSASSSICTSITPKSGNAACENRIEDSSNSKPSYMNLTESTKAKKKMSNHQYNRTQRQQSMDEFQFLKRTAVLSNGDSKISAGSDPSINFSRPLYLPTYLDTSSVKLH